MTIFPVTESTLSAPHLAEFVRSVYGLHSSTCKLFRTGMNHLYMVNDENRKFVLRVYTHHWRTKTEIDEEIRLLNHLKENGIPVAFPVASAEGQFVHELNAPEGPRHVVLFSFAEGKKNPRFTTEASYNIGVAMAKLQVVTRDYALERVTYDAKSLLDHSLPRTASFFTHKSEDMTYVKNLTKYLVNEYEKVKSDEVRSGALHLDIWFDNVHFNNNDNVTIFDFDFCGNGWLVHDVAYFLFQLFNTNLDEADYHAKAKSFLAGYESIVLLTAEEKRIIPITSLSVFLFFLSMQVDRYDTWSNIFLNEDHLKRFVGTLKKWAAFHQLPVA